MSCTTKACPLLVTWQINSRHASRYSPSRPAGRPTASLMVTSPWSRLRIVMVPRFMPSTSAILSSTGRITSLNSKLLSNV